VVKAKSRMDTFLHLEGVVHMATEGYKRKLSAILSTNVKGYSRLIGQDEVATVKTLKEYRELISILVGNTTAGWWIRRGTTCFQNLAVWSMPWSATFESRKNFRSKTRAFLHTAEWRFVLESISGR
jgi:hypothetical protein